MIGAHRELLTAEFRALSARLGSDAMQVQGAGGNTSIKDQDVMWIKASGRELADADTKDIFVAVDRHGAYAEALGKAGDGSCMGTRLDLDNALRPSIETTFHAALDYRVVAHTHSIATLIHAISPQGRKAAREKLAGLPFVMVPYAKPGLPLTREILSHVTPETKVIILQNHGLICCGDNVAAVADLLSEVERRLAMPARSQDPYSAAYPAACPAPDGFDWSPESWIAHCHFARKYARAGSYYPDHVVFLGPALSDHVITGRPAVLIEGQGIALRREALPSQRAMLRCLSDILMRLPEDWTIEPIGQAAEAELLNWDAEKHRQALAQRS